MTLKVSELAPLTMALSKAYREHPHTFLTTAEIWDHASRMEADRADLLGAIKSILALFDDGSCSPHSSLVVFARHLVARIEQQPYDYRPRAKDGDW